MKLEDGEPSIERRAWSLLADSEELLVLVDKNLWEVAGDASVLDWVKMTEKTVGRIREKLENHLRVRAEL